MIKKRMIHEKLFQFGFCAVLLFWVPVHAETTIQNLQKQCFGKYQVLTSSAYYKGHEHTRRLPEAGTIEKIQVISVTGKDCGLLKSVLGIDVHVGQQLTYGITVTTQEEAEAAAQERVGKIYPFQTVQSFAYKTAEGELPLFPLVHQEKIEILNFVSQVNAFKLYGTPLIEDLTDQQKQKILGIIYQQLVWEKAQLSLAKKDWFNLMLALNLNDIEFAKKNLDKLLLLFTNQARFDAVPDSSSLNTRLGKKINQLFNRYGSSHFVSKIEAIKKNPALLSREILDWPSDATDVPQLDESQIELFLNYALTESVNLAKVSHHVYDASILLSQYQSAAKAIQAHEQVDALTNWSYSLTQKAQQLIQQILSIGPE